MGYLLAGLFGVALGIGLTLLAGWAAYVAFVMNPWARHF